MRLPARVTGALVIGTALVVLVALLPTGARGPFSGSGPAAPAARATAVPAPVTTDPTAAFLDTYVGADGRVSRIDQGGDTVSEGQAYGLLLAVAARDRARFDRIWSWTAANLQRPDGLLSWTWKDGRVSDPSSAADADLDAAHALVAAGSVFGSPAYRAAGLRLGQAVLDHETAVTPLGRVLTAGSWATTEPWAVNPSYASQLAVGYLAAADGDPRWAELATGDRAVLTKLLGEAALPPDWAQVRADGKVFAMPAPANAGGAGDVRFGLDAARVAVRAAASCSSADRRLAARLDPVLARPAAQVRGAYDLGGSPLVTWEHPLQLVAVAAASGATGDPAGEQAYLAAAGQLARRAPTYYGAAWTALGRVLLTERSDLVPADCPADTEAQVAG